VSRRVLRLAAAAWLAVATVSCASRLTPLPAGPGASFPDYAAAYDRATARCRDVRTMRAVLRISGRAAGTRFPRAALDAGFASPGRVRLELPAPGKPLFIFVAADDRATLLLPRDSRALQNAPPAETLEALAGIAIAPDDLRAIVSGCGFGAGQASGGRLFEGGRAAIDVAGTVAYLQQVGDAWQLAAAVRGALEVRYADFVNGAPSTVRLRTGAGGDRATDLTVRLSQVDVNEPLGPEVFEVAIPPDARPLTLDELRQAGPLGR
jgi:hypothetical protein